MPFAGGQHISHRACLAIAFFCSFPGRFAPASKSYERGAGKQQGPLAAML
jgi:hypothetical protein